MKTKSQDYLPCVMSGLLLGLSVPSFSIVPLGFLAWVWLVPLLFSLKKTEKFLPFFGRVLLAVGIGFATITLWVVNASLPGLFASVLFGVVVWTLPLILFYFVRRFLGWKIALWSLPFVWTAWEFWYHQTAFSFGAIRLGYTQAEMLWLIQFADITGVDGVTFWLVLVNIAVFVFLDKQFSVENKQIKFADFVNAKAVLPIVLFVLPLAYSAFVFLKPQPQSKEISVIAIQPNVSPLIEMTPKRAIDVFAKSMAMTDKAVKTEKPDLILWHEVAVPYPLSLDAAANTYLAKQIKKWDTPLLTGITEVKNYAPNEPRPFLLERQNRDQEFFNAADLFQPTEIFNNHLDINLSNIYIKRRLMPFVERAPLVDIFPSLAGFIIPIGTRPDLSPGTNATTFDFQTKNGETVRIGTMICYENLYPDMSADLVRNGAQFLTAITNEGFFADSHGQYQLAAFARFRSIETRRAVVRAAATGRTWSTDKFGRVTAEVPLWSEQTLFAKVALSDEQTFFVKYGNLFAKFCVGIVLLLLLALVWKGIRAFFNNIET